MQRFPKNTILMDILIRMDNLYSIFVHENISGYIYYGVLVNTSPLKGIFRKDFGCIWKSVELIKI